MVRIDIVIGEYIYAVHINEDSTKCGCDIFNKEIWANGDRSEIKEQLTRSISFASGKKEVQRVVDPIMSVIGMRI